MNLEAFLRARLTTAAMLVRGLPVAGIDVTLGPPVTYVITYDPGALQAQKDQAAALIASLDWGTSFPDGMLEGADRYALWEHDFANVFASYSAPPMLSLASINNFLKLYPTILLAARVGYWGSVRNWINAAYTDTTIAAQLRDELLAITPTNADPNYTPPVTMNSTL